MLAERFCLNDISNRQIVKYLDQTYAAYDDTRADEPPISANARDSWETELVSRLAQDYIANAVDAPPPDR